MYKYIKGKVPDFIKFTYSRGHKKVNVSLSFYYSSLICSVFMIKNHFYDYNRFFKRLKPLTQLLRMCILTRNHLNVKYRRRL